MEERADIQWGPGLGHATVATMGQARGLIRFDPSSGGYVVRIITPQSRALHKARTLQEATKWVERELVRLAQAGAV